MKYQSIILIGDKTEISNISEVIKKRLNINQEISLVNFVNIKKSEEKESIGIQEVNMLSEFAYKRSDDLRVILIEDAHFLTEQAQNSLLKIIEEPPENLLILLQTLNLNTLLTTIQSRCLIVDGEHNESSIFSKNQVEQFLKSNYLERSRIIDKMISENYKRSTFLNFIEGILDYKLTQKDANNLESIASVYKGIKRGVNLKLCFDYLNNLID